MRPVDSISRAAELLRAQRPEGSVGEAVAKFDQVLENSHRADDDSLPRLVRSPLSERLAESPAAAAEGGRYVTAPPRVHAARELGETAGGAIEGRLRQVQASESASHEAMETFLSGGEIEIHSVMLAAQRAQLELQYAMKLRNKLLEAYQEVMRLPV